MRDRQTCVGCGKKSPETETNYTLISAQFGWRLTRYKAPDGSLVVEWRCPTCWREYKRARATPVGEPLSARGPASSAPSQPPPRPAMPRPPTPVDSFRPRAPSSPDGRISRPITPVVPSPPRRSAPPLPPPLPPPPERPDPRHALTDAPPPRLRTRPAPSRRAGASSP